MVAFMTIIAIVLLVFGYLICLIVSIFSGIYAIAASWEAGKKSQEGDFYGAIVPTLLGIVLFAVPFCFFTDSFELAKPISLTIILAIISFCSEHEKKTT